MLTQECENRIVKILRGKHGRRIDFPICIFTHSNFQILKSSNFSWIKWLATCDIKLCRKNKVRVEIFIYIEKNFRLNETQLPLNIFCEMIKVVSNTIHGVSKRLPFKNNWAFHYFLLKRLQSYLNYPELSVVVFQGLFFKKSNRNSSQFFFFYNWKYLFFATAYFFWCIKTRNRPISSDLASHFWLTKQWEEKTKVIYQILTSKTPLPQMQVQFAGSSQSNKIFPLVKIPHTNGLIIIFRLFCRNNREVKIWLAIKI